MTGTTLEEVITRVDNIKPNAFTNEQKTEWLNKVETMLQTEVLDKESEELIVYTYKDNHDTELIIKRPYSDVYDYYLMAMMSFAAGDVASYQNEFNMFNARYEDAQKAYRKSNPKTHFFKNWW